MSNVSRLARDYFFSILIYASPKFANAFLFIILGRFLGAHTSGLFALAATYLIILTALIRGLDELATREVSRNPQFTLAYFFRYSILEFSLSTLLYIVLYVIVDCIPNYTQEITVVIRILTLSIIPDSISYTSQAILLGQRRFTFPAIVTITLTLCRTILGSWIILNTGDLTQLSWVWLAGSILGAVVLSGWVLKEAFSGKHIFLKAPPSNIFREIIPFLLITILLTIEGQSDILILGSIRNQTDVSLYNAATTITSSLAIIAQAYRLAIYPVMAQYAVQSPGKLIHLHDESLRYLASMAFPMAIGIGVLAGPFVLTIYGPEFAPTIVVLQILIPILGYGFLNVPNARLMLVQNRQQWNLLFYALSTLMNIGLNLVLDSTWGVNGAATARLCSTSLYFLLSYIYVQKNLTKSNALPILTRPLLAALIMGGIIWLLRSLPLVILISLGIAIYVIVLWLVGGITSTDKARIQQIIQGKGDLFWR